MAADLVPETPQITLSVLAAQQGNIHQRERLLEQYQPFMLSAASATCGRSITKSDDEASVALIAFNEAIDTFAEGKGAPFLAFARLVIQRRVTDYYRSQKPKLNLLSLDAPGTEDGDRNYTWEAEQAAAEFTKTVSSLEYQQEFEEYERILGGYGISFDDLILASPKHEDARAICFHIARRICENRLLREYLRETRHLPVKNLAREAGVHRRTVERHRKYILAIYLLFEHRLTSICEYIGLNWETSLQTPGRSENHGTNQGQNCQDQR